ncbi:MAG TPA: shikimate kinase [Phycisphaeraceae bacterium]|nr:shikimate kinase [Phycisphaeraceae bacterium]
MNIILTGLRGSGKSTIGRDLAEELWRDFIDLDDRVLALFNETTIVDVFRNKGEQAWREAEVKALAEVMKKDNCIIALGGGTAMIPEAAEILQKYREKRGDKIIYLKASAKVLRDRLNNETGDRPSLTGTGVADEVEQVLKKRDTVYENLADAVLLVDDLTVTEAGRFIVRLVM